MLKFTTPLLRIKLMYRILSCFTLLAFAAIALSSSSTAMAQSGFRSSAPAYSAPTRIFRQPLQRSYYSPGSATRTYSAPTVQGGSATRVYSPPVYSAPAQQGSATRVYSAPTYSTPTYSAPTYSTPTYSAPTYSAPTYSAPTYSTPSFGGSGSR